MAELKELSTIRNFKMLDQFTHKLFTEYIIAGRKRAPPEIDLRYMISTFQCGARTDRRALQSKFKSWSKRMVVENNKLKLLYSGKEIIPIEKCCELVMRIHVDGHKSVDRVISQIKETYTWSKKNFGMERAMVTEFISTNCPKRECQQQTKIEITREKCNNFIKNTASERPPEILSSSTMNFMNNPMYFNSPFYALPVMFPITKTVMPNDYYLPYNFQNGSALEQFNPFASIIKKKKKSKRSFIKENYISEMSCSKDSYKNHKILQNKMCKKQSTSKKNFGMPGTFQKPKNINHFKDLIKAAEQLTTDTLLNDSKTKFLGCLDLVPKKICSKRTLWKCEKENMKKRILEKQHKIYNANRKNLRDRNKLNKIKLKEQREKRAYLCASGSRKDVKHSVEKSEHLLSSVLKNQVDSSKNSEIELIKIVPALSKINKSEVVHILSSEDEGSSGKSDLKKNIIFTKKDDSKCFKDYLNKNIELYKNFDFAGRKKTSLKELSIPKLEKLEDPVKKGLDSENVFSKNEIRNKLNIFSNRRKYLPPPILKPQFIPANIKSEIAVIPASQSLSMKPLKLIKPRKNSQKLTVSEGYIGKAENTPPVLQPLSNTLKLKSQSSKGFQRIYPLKKLPPDTNIFLIRKTQSGSLMMVPCERKLTINVSSPQSSSDLKSSAFLSRAINPVKQLRTTDFANTQSKIIFTTQKKDKNDNSLNMLNSNERFANEEMLKLSMWIKKMKKSLAQFFFHLNMRRSTERLESQLNAGIALIQNIRKKLYESQKLEQQKSCT